MIKNKEIKLKKLDNFIDKLLEIGTWPIEKLGDLLHKIFKTMDEICEEACKF